MEYGDPAEYDRVAGDEESAAVCLFAEPGFVEQAQRSGLQIDKQTFGLYFVVDMVRYEYEPTDNSEEEFQESRKHKKISAVWLTTFGWRPRLGVFKLP